jgi:hypothetical protein
LEKSVTSPTYDPPDRPADSGVGPSDPRLSETVRQPGTFAETSKSEAASVKDTAAEAASGVADVARSEVTNVAKEAKYQTRNLVDQTRSELRGQASNQQSQLAAKVHDWASEVGAMASKSNESGPMTDLAYEASRRGGEIAHWLDTHEPGDVLEEVKRFARRRPVAFLALAAAAGVVAGRLTRGAVAANTSVDSDTEATPARAYDSNTYRGDYEGDRPSSAAYGARSYQDGGYAPRHSETSVPPETTYQGTGNPVTGQFHDTGMAAPGQYPGTPTPDRPAATGTASPNVTPAVDEPDYPPPVGGDVRR